MNSPSRVRLRLWNSTPVSRQQQNGKQQPNLSSTNLRLQDMNCQ